jgi:SAM-dependent methyltransferase
MTYDYHRDRAQYFEHQRRVTREHVIPFIQSAWRIPPAARVLEIGCAEAGVLRAFLDLNCTTVGVDLNRRRLDKGRELLEADVQAGKHQFIHGNIYDDDVAQQLGRFDLIVLKDVIEHIDDQAKLLRQLEGHLAPGGAVFFGFPPWFMPFGGHQQVCQSKLLSRAPYIHLLPPSWYAELLRRLGEPQTRIDSLLEIQRTGLNVERFEQLLGQTGYDTLAQQLYLLNPMYDYRFGFGGVRQARVITRLPYVRDLLSTCAYYLVRPA